MFLEHQISILGMISAGSNDAENSALKIHRNKLHLK